MYYEWQLMSHLNNLIFFCIGKKYLSYFAKIFSFCLTAQWNHNSVLLHTEILIHLSIHIYPIYAFLSTPSHPFIHFTSLSVYLSDLLIYLWVLCVAAPPVNLTSLSVTQNATKMAYFSPCLLIFLAQSRRREGGKEGGRRESMNIKLMKIRLTE